MRNRRRPPPAAGGTGADSIFLKRFRATAEKGRERKTERIEEHESSCPRRKRSGASACAKAQRHIRERKCLVGGETGEDSSAKLSAEGGMR